MRQLEKTIAIDAKPADVFAALTEPDLVTSVFPFDSIESDGSTGGRFICKGSVEGEPFTDFGTITCYEKDRCFGYRYWSTNHGTERAPENEIHLVYRIEDQNGQVSLSVEQQNLHSDSYLEMMDAAWDAMLNLFKETLENP